MYVCSFTDYNQSINSPEAVRGRLLKYLIPVIISSVAFNVPKFMEARVEYYSEINGTMTSFNSSIHDGVEYFTDINGTTTVFNSSIHDEDEEYEFLEWTPQVIFYFKGAITYI